MMQSGYVYGAGILMLTGCAFSVADQKEISAVDSPDGGFKLTVTSWDVGATAPTAYHVSVSRAGFFSNESVEVAVVDSVPNENDFQVRWTSSHEVSVRVAEARVFKNLGKVVVGGQPVTVRLNVGAEIK